LSRKLTYLLQAKDDASREEAERVVWSSLKKYAICLLTYVYFDTIKRVSTVLWAVQTGIM
jgi:hypothetical protein